MGQALDGVRVLDMTHVPSGLSCTQLLAWFGADVIKVEGPGEGDPTRTQLRDIPDVDSLSFTMLNGNKRDITLNRNTEAGKRIFAQLIEQCDVIVDSGAPGVIDPMGLSWEEIQRINPRMIYALVTGFGPGPFEHCDVDENVAQCTGGAASTTGEIDGVPLVTGAEIGDSGTGIHLVAGILAALYQREKSGRGQRVICAMQDAVLNLCRVKLRDQQALDPDGMFGAAVPRAGNASGGGHPGCIVKCKGWETDPDAYVCVIAQAQAFPTLAKVIGHADWLDDPNFNTPDARLPRLAGVFAEIEKWTVTMTKTEVMATLSPLNVPCGPILSMSELAQDPALRSTGTVVEVDHPQLGKYVTVGNPIKLSDSPTEVRRSPLLGEHTEEVLRSVLGLGDDEIQAARQQGAI
jgi:formyl-CoA transferase